MSGDLRFEGKVAVVTGAASGIGHATAVGLWERGARVALLDQNVADGSRLNTELNERRQASALFVELDVSNAAAMQEAVDEIIAKFGGIDVVAHCAGMQSYGTAASTGLTEWDRTLGVDLDSGFYLARAVLPFLQQRRGSMVLTGSTQSLVAHKNSAAYVTGKHAVVGLMRSIAVDFAAHGVRCNCVLPGAIDTPMIRWSANREPDPQRVLDACHSLALLGRMGTAREVANAILFLLSDMASYVTGICMVVDGGQLVPCGGTAFQSTGTGNAE